MGGVILHLEETRRGEDKEGSHFVVLQSIKKYSLSGLVQMSQTVAAVMRHFHFLHKLLKVSINSLEEQGSMVRIKWYRAQWI